MSNLWWRSLPLLGAILFLLAGAPTARALTSDMVFIGHARGYSSVKALNINTGKEVPILEFKRKSAGVFISPDERMLVWDEGNKILFFDHATQKTSTLFTSSSAISYMPSKFLPTGELLYVKNFNTEKTTDTVYRWGSFVGSHEYWKYSFKTGRHQRLTKKDSEWLWRGTLSPDGKYNLLFPQNSALGHGGNKSVIGNTKILLKSPASTKEVVYSTGIAKTNPSFCWHANFSPKSTFALFSCGETDQTYTTLFPLVVSRAAEGYSRDGSLQDQTPQWISDTQFLNLTHGAESKTSQEISIVNMGDADPEFHKLVALSKDSNKIFFNDVRSRGTLVLYIQNTLENGKVTQSKLIKYDPSKGKTSVVLVGKPQERLSLQLQGEPLSLNGAF